MAVRVFYIRASSISGSLEQCRGLLCVCSRSHLFLVPPLSCQSLEPSTIQRSAMPSAGNLRMARRHRTSTPAQYSLGIAGMCRLTRFCVVVFLGYNAKDCASTPVHPRELQMHVSVIVFCPIQPTWQTTLKN